MSPSSRFERWKLASRSRSNVENVLVEVGHPADEEFLVRTMRRLADMSGPGTPAVIIESVERSPLAP
jgi:hypothetical protein